MNKNKMNKDEISKRGTALGEQHFNYIKKLLLIHNEDEKVIDKIEFHYIQAMKHGYKHGINDKLKVNGKNNQIGTENNNLKGKSRS